MGYQIEQLCITLRGNCQLCRNCQFWSKFQQKPFDIPEISAHAQQRDYWFIHTVHKFHDMVSVGNLFWGYLLINGCIDNAMNIVTWLFFKMIFRVQLLTRNVKTYFTSAVKVTFKCNRSGKRTVYNLHFQSHMIKFIKPLINFICQHLSPI